MIHDFRRYSLRVYQISASLPVPDGKFVIIHQKTSIDKSLFPPCPDVILYIRHGKRLPAIDIRRK
jgi:hypothetical protein